jgi:hypothetical protein
MSGNVIVPSQAGGFEIIGPVGVIGTPQLSLTVGNVGTTTLKDNHVPAVGGSPGMDRIRWSLCAHNPGHFLHNQYKSMYT